MERVRIDPTVRMSAAEARRRAHIDRKKVASATEDEIREHAREDGNAMPPNVKLKRRSERLPTASNVPIEEDP